MNNEANVKIFVKALDISTNKENGITAGRFYEVIERIHHQGLYYLAVENDNDLIIGIQVGNFEQKET